MTYGTAAVAAEELVAEADERESGTSGGDDYTGVNDRRVGVSGSNW